MLGHVIVLLILALIVSEVDVVQKLTIITSPVSDVEEPPSEIELQDLDDAPVEEVEPVPNVVVVADAAIDAPDSGAVLNALDPQPIGPTSDAMTDFMAPGVVSDSLGMKIGGTGLEGGGLDGRGQAAKRAPRDAVQAVDRALTWIAIHQMPDGGWSFDMEACPSCMGKCSHSGTSKKDDRAGATAMALLPFLGRGFTHREGPYQKQVEAGIAFLTQRAMKDGGKVYDKSGSLYSQGLAGIALSECYAMTQDQRLAAPTQAVLNFIMQAQDPQGGGWRYTPRQPGDTSAVGWQIMALKSGNMAYLDVNPLTVKKAVEFLESVKGDEYGATYGYTSPGNRLGTSAVGLLCRMYLGWKKDNPGLQEGAATIAKAGPSKDLYYDYYATQIMHHMQGEMWTAWDAKMKKMLIDSQATKDHEAGSWYDGVDLGHGANAAGRLYCTSLATMILEVYYRHLPIFGTQSVDDEFRE
jgi:hypothetical protein